MDFELGENFKVETTIDAQPFVLLGVHTYDLKAINQMDKIWSENNEDQHYKARRSAATIIALEPTRASEWSFWSSMKSFSVSEGFDLLLTDLGDKYAMEIGTDKGKTLLKKYAPNAKDASDADLKKRDEVRSAIPSLCGKDREIKADHATISKKASESMDNPIWDELAEKCLSCASCNLVCPTCYCFDVKDNISLDLKHGERVRTWDACLLQQFANVASGENFRKNKADRFRHRIMRKTVYVANKLGGELACVGCGRCSSACLPDIADPVKIINKICS